MKSRKLYGARYILVKVAKNIVRHAHYSVNEEDIR